MGMMLSLSILFLFVLCATQLLRSGGEGAESRLEQVLIWDGTELKLLATSDAETSLLLEHHRSQIPPGYHSFFFQGIPINFADKRLLMTIPGIGPHLAHEIIRTRDEKGFFQGVQGLLAIPGIGEKRLEQFGPYFSFDLEP